MEYDPMGCFLRVGMSDVVIQLYLSAKMVANNLFLAVPPDKAQQITEFLVFPSW